MNENRKNDDKKRQRLFLKNKKCKNWNRFLSKACETVCPRKYANFKEAHGNFPQTIHKNFNNSKVQKNLFRQFMQIFVQFF